MSLFRRIVTNVDCKKALEKESHIGRDSHDPSTCVLNHVCYEAELFARCSLLLLVIFCSFLVTFCSSLVTFACCSLLFTCCLSLLVTRVTLIYLVD